MADKPKKLLIFVCTGNICRSPMAEVIFQHRLGPESDWEVISAGTFGMEGAPASQNSTMAVGEWEMDLSGHSSRQLTVEWVEKADLIVTMTEGHRMDILASIDLPAEKVRVLGSFSNDPHARRDVMDPIGGSLSVYRKVRDQINGGISDLILFMIDEGMIDRDSLPKA